MKDSFARSAVRRSLRLYPVSCASPSCGCTLDGWRIRIDGEPSVDYGFARVDFTATATCRRCGKVSEYTSAVDVPRKSRDKCGVGR